MATALKLNAYSTLVVQQEMKNSKSIDINPSCFYFAMQLNKITKNKVHVRLQAGANVTHADEYGRTSLHLAARNGHASMCTLLLAAGAQVDAPDNDGRTPLMYAAARGHGDVVSVLLEVGPMPQMHQHPMGS
jgi:ankyrin repeat protein